MPEQLQATLTVAGRWGAISRVDPRARIVVALLFSLLVAIADRPAALGVAVVAAIAAVLLSGVPIAKVLRRLLPLNVLMIVLVVLLPLVTEGTALWSLGSVNFSREGLLLAVGVAVKGNCILAGLLALLGTLDAVVLGHALSHLRLPDKLTQLLLFTVRYIDVLHGEYVRLSAAMKVRGFRPRVDRHTYRSYGHLLGMLLVRSLDRAERVVDAMKCRGFRGHFHLFGHFHFARRDMPFCLVAATVLLALVLVQWT
jgi:cobalt/nickel transport system permease protein